MSLRQQPVLVAPVAGRSCRNGACGTGLQLEKGYPGAGSTEADGADGLRRLLFFRFQKANAPTSRGICFWPGLIVFSHSLQGRLFLCLEPTLFATPLSRCTATVSALIRRSTARKNWARFLLDKYPSCCSAFNLTAGLHSAPATAIYKALGIEPSADSLRPIVDGVQEYVIRGGYAAWCGQEDAGLDLWNRCRRRQLL